jgi:hypothetical protein
MREFHANPELAIGAFDSRIIPLTTSGLLVEAIVIANSERNSLSVELAGTGSCGKAVALHSAVVANASAVVRAMFFTASRRRFVRISSISDLVCGL